MYQLLATVWAFAVFSTPSLSRLEKVAHRENSKHRKTDSGGHRINGFLIKADPPGYLT
jgi:hypothetical protein